MRWVIIQNNRILFAGSYEGALDAAERAGCIEHLIYVEKEDGGLKRITLRGRGFYPDGTEIPPRIVGAVMIPEAMLPGARKAKS
jgi:hypothetical protein